MKMHISVAAIALAFVAAPLSAQILPRGGDGSTRTGSSARDRIETIEGAIEAARRGGTVSDQRTSTRSSSRIPPGHLPPRGACRVWIDGVPPGQQPPVTSCAHAERDRFRYSNARVIYGDAQSFPGKGKGKFKNGQAQQRCSILDGVVINGRVNDVCRDDSIYGNARARSDRNVRWEDDSDSDSDRKRGKANGKAAKARSKAVGKGRG